MSPKLMSSSWSTLANSTSDQQSCRHRYLLPLMVKGGQSSTGGYINIAARSEVVGFGYFMVNGYDSLFAVRGLVLTVQVQRVMGIVTSSYFVIPYGLLHFATYSYHSFTLSSLYRYIFWLRQFYVRTRKCRYIC